jgi:folylpolyglutamate synthase/dihydrofolate synthase
MSYSSVIEYLYGLQKHGIKLGLETMRLLLDRVGNPQASLQVLHVGGTNGKGSTASMAAAVLHCAGRRVGLYTSPHLVDFRERIRINGRMIPEDRVEVLLTRLRAVLADDLHPTFFEMTTALAFLHFSESRVDVAVLEVGLGGRFDATNVVEQPLACAITTIGMDHQEYLGNTEAAIAFEKGGIIKPYVPVVMGRMGPEAEQVLSRIAKDRSAPLRRLGQEFSLERDRAGRLVYHGGTHVIEGVGVWLSRSPPMGQCRLCIGASRSRRSTRDDRGRGSGSGRVEDGFLGRAVGNDRRGTPCGARWGAQPSCGWHARSVSDRLCHPAPCFTDYPRLGYDAGQRSSRVYHSTLAGGFRDRLDSSCPYPNRHGTRASCGAG